MDTRLCVTLDEQVTVPGGDHEPPQTTVFRADEHTERDEYTVFYGLNIGPENTTLRVANGNIRSISFIPAEE